MAMGLSRHLIERLKLEIRQVGYETVFMLIIVMTLSGCVALGGNYAQSENPSVSLKHKTLPNGKIVDSQPANSDTQPQVVAVENNSENNEQLSSFSEECKERIRQTRKFFVDTKSGEKATYVKVAATGYGAPPKNYYPEGQRRLMTIRASKIDAYRALAEIVGGVHVWGGTAISNMVLEKDRYRVFIDTYVRGARAVSVNEMKDDTYQTVVEMHVDQLFLSQVMAFVDPLLAQCLKGDETANLSIKAAQDTIPSFYYSE